MTSTVYKWRIYCQTSAQYEELWSVTEPTLCPVNTAHTITTGSAAIIDQISINEVKIKENDVPTNGYYQVDHFYVEAAANTTTNIDFTNSDYDFNIYSISYQTEETHRGDSMDITINPNTVVGVITANLNASSTEATVSSTVLQYIKPGFRVNFTDGVNTDVCGLVTDVNTVTSKITFNTANTHAFAAATPTYVRMTVAYTKSAIKIGGPMNTVFGAGKIGGSYVPRSTVVRVAYTNTSPTDSKTLVIYTETDY